MTTIVDHKERIIRGTYEPIFYNRLRNKYNKRSAFRLRANENGVSVIRLEYINIHGCKKYLKFFENDKLKFHGVGILKIDNLIECAVGSCKIEVLYKPRIDEPKLPEHAEIFFYLDGTHFIAQENKELPPDINSTIDKILKIVTFYEDEDKSHDDWTGEKISPDSLYVESI
jgi:hypothetical protein